MSGSVTTAEEHGGTDYRPGKSLTRYLPHGQVMHSSAKVWMSLKLADLPGPHPSPERSSV